MSAINTPLALKWAKPLWWSVRRELWENRAVFVAPAVVGLLEVLGFLIHSARLPEDFSRMMESQSMHRDDILGMGYGFSAVPIVVVSVIVATFYCLDCLYSERRDRSILFWKSLPVPDSVTVASKALIPLAVLPLVTYAVILVTQLLTVAIGAASLSLHGMASEIGWATKPMLPMLVILAYGLVTMSLWYAPLFGWLFLVSSFARRTPFLWAVLPPIAVNIVEHFAFGTHHFSEFLQDRLWGQFAAAFVTLPGQRMLDQLSQLDPIGFVSNPGLWGGLIAAGLFFTGAVMARRYREPV